MSKASGPPKCKLCGAEHWLNEGHKLQVGYDRSPAVVITTDGTQIVTKPVTTPERVTPIVTEAAMVTAAVTSSHECPICGLLHHRPKTSAERQRESRERKRG